MKTLITDEFASQYNWAGRDPKRPFKNLRIKDLVKGKGYFSCKLLCNFVINNSL